MSDERFRIGGFRPPEDFLRPIYARAAADRAWQEDLHRTLQENHEAAMEGIEEEAAEKERDRELSREYFANAKRELTEAAEERRLARADREQAKADREAQLEEAAAARREAAEQHERNLAELARRREEDQRDAAEQRAKDQRYRAITITVSIVALLVSGSLGTYAALKPAPAPQVIVVPASPAPQLPAPR